MKKKFHLALASNNIQGTILDYSKRLGCQPCAMVSGVYALWRTDTLNVSVRHDPKCRPGELRHLGFEDASVSQFATDFDINGIVWESFTAEQQAQEIENAWPGTGYTPKD